MALGSKTLKVLDKLTTLTNEQRMTPTLRELAKDCGFSSTWPVRYHLEKLIEAGYIKMKKNTARGIELLKQSAGIPVLGRISAGKPIDAIENVEEHIDSITDMFGLKNMFALRVTGDSMTGAGIFDGDTVIINKQKTAANGEIIAALLENEATVKRFFLTPDGVKLVAENPKYSPIISKEIKVLGKVVGVIRKLK
jgi:repressor LexA